MNNVHNNIITFDQVDVETERETDDENESNTNQALVKSARNHIKDNTKNGKVKKNQLNITLDYLVTNKYYARLY